MRVNTQINVEGCLRISSHFGNANVLAEGRLIQVNICDFYGGLDLSLRQLTILRRQISESVKLTETLGITVIIRYKNNILVTLGREVEPSKSNEFLTGSSKVKLGNIRTFLDVIRKIK
jgi:hypothetical protein